MSQSSAASLQEKVESTQLYYDHCNMDRKKSYCLLQRNSEGMDLIKSIITTKASNRKGPHNTSWDHQKVRHLNTTVGILNLKMTSALSHSLHSGITTLKSETVENMQQNLEIK